MTLAHLLGVGSIGMMVANGLAQAEPTMVNNLKLVLKSMKSYSDYVAVDHTVTVNTMESALQLLTSKFSFGTFSGFQAKENFENLLVATKAHQAEKALLLKKNNITADTNIFLLMNGMGIRDKIVRNIWPNPKLRPSIYECVLTHGCYKFSPFVCNHVGIGSMLISGLNRGPKPEIVKLLEKAPTLNAKQIYDDQFLLIQIEKLIINACINPLTAVLDCKNGELLQILSRQYHKIMKNVIREALRVLRQEYPELRDIEDAQTTLDPDRLLRRVFEICRLTKENSSSMREDVRNSKPTEIDFLNGYIQRLGQHYGLNTPSNNVLIGMVRSKLMLERKREKISLDDAIDELMN